MPTRSVNLTAELDRFVATKVKSGRYENASEVVRAGLRTLEREEQPYEAKLAALQAAIDEGDASGIAEGNAFGRFRKPRASRVAIAMGRFRPSRRAEVGLLSEYTLHKWGKAQAARYIGELEVCCQTLADNPALGGICDHVRPGLAPS